MGSRVEYQQYFDFFIITLIVILRQYSIKQYIKEIINSDYRAFFV